MKKTLLLITFVFGLGSSAWASTCASGTLAVYDVPGFTCSLGDITFSNFMYTSSAFGGALAPPDSGVAVTPVTSGFGTDTGLLFTSGWLVASGETIDSSITYDVSTTNPGGITDLDLVTAGGAANGGLASVAEISVAPSESLFTEFGAGPGIPSDSVTFPPVMSLDLTKDIGVTGGTSGAAHLSDVYNLFSEGTSTMTPEPSLVILCAGLIGLVPLARRKFAR